MSILRLCEKSLVKSNSETIHVDQGNTKPLKNKCNPNGSVVKDEEIFTGRKLKDRSLTVAQDVSIKIRGNLFELNYVVIVTQSFL